MAEESADQKPHRAGFVSIVGKPNVGKSTLMNVLVGERLSIITSKAQTTRHRIMGILNGVNNGALFQMVYSDTPGIITPAYKLHEAMMAFVKNSLNDADVILFVTEVFEKPENNEAVALLKYAKAPIVLAINKVDLAKEEEVEVKKAEWQKLLSPRAVMAISALKSEHTDELFNELVNLLPEHPAYFPKDELTNRPERFFVSEILREKILLNYKQEIPYSTEVVISEFREKEDMVVIRAEILVERNSQKGILIGEGGSMLKKVGSQARADMEAFLGKKVFLEQHVKVEPNWRSNSNKLREFGYSD